MKVRIVTLTLLMALLATPAHAWTHKQHRVRHIIAIELHKKHVARADVRAALKLAYRESTYRPASTTGSCKGLFQLKTHYGRRLWADPAWNTRKANRYVDHRYGSWRRALAHSYRCGWY